MYTMLASTSSPVLISISGAKFSTLMKRMGMPEKAEGYRSKKSDDSTVNRAREAVDKGEGLWACTVLHSATCMFAVVVRVHTNLGVGLVRTDDAVQRSRVASVTVNTPEKKPHIINNRNCNKQTKEWQRGAGTFCYSRDMLAQVELGGSLVRAESAGELSLAVHPAHVTHECVVRKELLLAVRTRVRSDVLVLVLVRLQPTKVHMYF